METPAAGIGALRFRLAPPASAEAASPTLNAHAVACHVLYDYADLRIYIKNGEAAWPRSSTQERMEALNVAGVVRAQQQAAGARLRARAHHIGSRGVLIGSALGHQR